MRIIFLSLFFTGFLFAEKEIARTNSYQSSPYGNYPYQEKSPWTKQTQETSYLYILHAKDGHLQASNYDSYELTLYYVDKNITYFADRPSRKAGKLSLSQFLDRWSRGRNSFRKDSPNAAIVTALEGRGQTPVTLSNPRYDMQNDRLIFQVTLLEKSESPQMGDLGEVTLFIDNDAAAL